MNKLTTGDLDKILDILAKLIENEDKGIGMAVPTNKKRDELIRLANALQTYLYNKLV